MERIELALYLLPMMWLYAMTITGQDVWAHAHGKLPKAAIPDMGLGLIAIGLCQLGMIYCAYVA